jgi:hypothetical protein
MKQSCANCGSSRRQFLVSGVSFAGMGLALISASLLSGCGNDDKGAGQVETPVDPTKTQSGMDSMKAYLQKKQEMKGGTKKN